MKKRKKGYYFSKVDWARQWNLDFKARDEKWNIMHSDMSFGMWTIAKASLLEKKLHNLRTKN